MKLIELCRYTINQSMYDNEVYAEFRTAGDILEAQELIDNLNKQEVKNGISRK